MRAQWLRARAGPDVHRDPWHPAKESQAASLSETRLPAGESVRDGDSDEPKRA